ncbi:hypothetical protein ARMGADRAFT_1036848 [Armillaria gallica]|uniref:CxC2-like cysteine cluster KDZ transposase-associated domain-containing protein n=1 Tax=Armillaria gallica TaxID=47427 RepID=A0A2H3DBR0_ARMGA|nr:hypothetical protein ARMGADRAFT_1036848 [Armillaria gallica]
MAIGPRIKRRMCKLRTAVKSGQAQAGETYMMLGGPYTLVNGLGLEFLFLASSPGLPTVMSSPLLCQTIVRGLRGAPRGRGSGRGSRIGRGRGRGLFWNSNSIEVYGQNQHGDWVPLSTSPLLPTMLQQLVIGIYLFLNLRNMQEMSDMLMEDMIHLTPPRRKRNLEDEPLPKWTKQIDTTGTDRCDTCGMDDGGSYRCTVCTDVHSSCGACMVKQHASLPFHHIQEWTGSFYMRTTLKDLRLVIQLGHGTGESCLRPAENSRSMVVIDIDGIHEVSVNFCGCHRAEAQYVQLLWMRWFPATVDLPRTAVTFRALNHFQMLTFMSKVSAYEYYHMLSRLMDNTGVHPLPDRYQVFLRVIWEWRHLQMLKRHGRGNDTSGVQGTAEDANFRLVRLDVSSDLCDPGLNHGFAYFVEESAFQSHLAQFHDKLPAETNTCNNHDAIKLASLHGKGTAASGVGAVVCARHDMRCPSSIADLHKGEDYLHMDYVVLKTLQQGTPDQVVISYDIACQWSVNFWCRAESYGSGFLPPQTPNQIVFLVPKFHLAAHIEKCQDMLDDHFNDHNWCKVTTIIVMLLRRIKDTVPEHASTWDTFEGLSDRLSADNPMTIVKWTEEVENWENGRTTENPFEPCVKAMSVASVRLRLAQEERDQPSVLADFSMLPSASEMIREGLALERSQHNLLYDHNQLGVHSTDLQWAKIIERCNRLRRNIENWMDIQCVYIPQVHVIRGEEEQGRNTLVRDHAIRVDDSLLRHEWDLRVAGAEEALDEIRRKIILETYVQDYRKEYGHGQRQGTWTAKLLSDCVAAKNRSIGAYRCAREAMVGWRNVYQCLNDEDTCAVLTNQVEGEGRRKLSWIWMAPGSGSSSSPEHVQDALRLEWLNACARANRWSEECDILVKEMARVLRLFQHEARVWMERAEKSLPGTAGGVRAYTLRQAALHLEMHDHCVRSWTAVQDWVRLGTVADTEDVTISE